MAASTKKVIFVVGPTASGKSAWALTEAIKHQGSIVNIDSVQFYEGLEIGSAAPTADEKKAVPHYLYSYVKAPGVMTAGTYVDDFYKLVDENQIKFPLFIVGGTGFYVQVLEKGLFDVEKIPGEFREQLEFELQSAGPEKLFAELTQKDPDHKIHINDHYRLVRSLEIIRATGQKPTQMQADPKMNKKALPFEFIKVGFSGEKDFLLKRVQERTLKMMANGLIDETQFFLNQQRSDWPPLSSVGYKETQIYLKNKYDKEWLFEAIVQATMKLIKKQKTWFKRDNSILWSDQSLRSEQFLRGH